MNLDLLETLRIGQSIIQSPWEADDLAALGARPVELPSRSYWLLRADAKVAWLRWWIEGFVPVDTPFDDELRRKGRVLKHVSASLKLYFPLLGEIERTEFTRLVAETALSIDVDKAESRPSISVKMRQSLLDFSGDVPRCYLCGSRFSTQAVQRFMGSRDELPQVKVIIDFVFPRGVQRKDTSIVVEHVRPLRDGGSASDLRNLRLACDYCNSIKSDALTLYSRGQYRSKFTHPQLGPVMPPNPYWVVRTLAVDGKCAECGRTAADSELFVATRSPLRYMNPTGLEVYCAGHDPLSEFRWVSTALLA